MRTKASPRRRAMTRGELSEALAKMRDTRIRLARAIVGVERPERYHRQAVALLALQTLPTALDNFLSDFEAGGDLRRCDKPAERRLRAVQRELEGLLRATWRAQADTFTLSAGGDRSTGERWANEMGDVAVFISRVVSFILEFCTASEDGWRLEELSRKLDELATPEARELRMGRVRERSLRLLRDNGMDGADDARRVMAELDEKIAAVEAARRSGAPVYALDGVAP